jgi:triosephosphate isomerase
MTDRVPLVAGNWKMNKSAVEARAFVNILVQNLAARAPVCDVLVAPPFTALPAVLESLNGTAIKVAAQNVFWEDSGAFTGEISAPMIRDLGCTHVIIGHSERRQLFGDTDTSVCKKLQACLRSNLIPIFCLGETLDQRECGSTFAVVKRQLMEGLGSVEFGNPRQLILAYEPVWAIGTGRNATPLQAQEVHSALRGDLATVFGASFAQQVLILYGGSVKPDNAKSLFDSEDIDGGLIGGASLKADDFLGIIYSA